MRLSFYSGLILAAIAADNIAEAVNLNLEAERTGLSTLAKQGKAKANEIKAKIENNHTVSGMEAAVYGLDPRMMSKKGKNKAAPLNRKFVPDVHTTEDLHELIKDAGGIHAVKSFTTPAKAEIDYLHPVPVIKAKPIKDAVKVKAIQEQLMQPSKFDCKKQHRQGMDKAFIQKVFSPEGSFRKPQVPSLGPSADQIYASQGVNTKDPSLNAYGLGGGNPGGSSLGDSGLVGVDMGMEKGLGMGGPGLGSSGLGSSSLGGSGLGGLGMGSNGIGQKSGALIGGSPLGVADPLTGGVGMMNSGSMLGSNDPMSAMAMGGNPLLGGSSMTDPVGSGFGIGLGTGLGTAGISTGLGAGLGTGLGIGGIMVPGSALGGNSLQSGLPSQMGLNPLTNAPAASSYNGSIDGHVDGMGNLHTSSFNPMMDSQMGGIAGLNSPLGGMPGSSSSMLGGPSSLMPPTMGLDMVPPTMGLDSGLDMMPPNFSSVTPVGLGVGLGVGMPSTGIPLGFTETASKTDSKSECPCKDNKSQTETKTDSKAESETKSQTESKTDTEGDCPCKDKEQKKDD